MKRERGAGAPVLLAAILAATPARAVTNYVAYGGTTLTFRPSNLTIHYGDTVIWTNAGGTHTVTGVSAGETLCGNANVSICTHTFFVAGDILYHCNPHAGLNMTGIVHVLPPVAVSAVLTNAMFSNGMFRFTVLAAPQRTNIVQVSSNLGISNWSAVATVLPATNSFSFIDTNPASSSRFYRVVEP